MGRTVPGEPSTNSYVWGLDLSGTLSGAGGIGGLLSASFGGSSVTSTVFYSYDANGNVSELISTNGAIAAHYEYSPFGETVVATGPLAKENKFRFSTKYTDDETAMLYYGFRYYHPGVGRWPSRDPIGEKGGLNIYGYCKNNSISRFDVLGKWCCDTCDPLKDKPRVLNFKTSLEEANRGVSPGVRDTGTSVIGDIQILSYLQLGGGIASGLAKSEGVLVEVLLSLLDFTPDEARTQGYEEAILGAINSIDAAARQRNGVAIWVHVKWKKCEKTSCMLFWERNDWIKHEGWHRCSACNSDNLFPGFDANDTSAIGNAIPGCIAEAVSTLVQ